MGINIKRKKIKGVEMYQLRSTISDELYHKEDWVTIDGAKKALMESKVWKFCEELVQVDMEFPNFYHVNGKPPKAYSDKTMQRFCEYALKNYFTIQISSDQNSKTINFNGNKITCSNII